MSQPVGGAVHADLTGTLGLHHHDRHEADSQLLIDLILRQSIAIAVELDLLDEARAAELLVRDEEVINAMNLPDSLGSSGVRGQLGERPNTL